MEHHFDVGVAMEYGVIEAILINNFQYWINKNIANGTNFRDGRFWTYNSKSALQDLFPYLTYDKIRRALERLVDNGVLLTGRYSDDPRDRTLWYSLSDKFIDFWGKRPMQYSEMPDASGKNAQALKDNKQQIKNTDNITPLSPTGDAKKFRKPSIEEIEEYVREQGYAMDASYFYDYYESNGWCVGKKPMKDWKAAVRNWMRNEKLRKNGNNTGNRQTSIQYGNPIYGPIVKEMERELGPLNF